MKCYAKITLEIIDKTIGRRYILGVTKKRFGYSTYQVENTIFMEFLEKTNQMAKFYSYLLTIKDSPFYV